MLQPPEVEISLPCLALSSTFYPSFLCWKYVKEFTINPLNFYLFFLFVCCVILRLENKSTKGSLVQWKLKVKIVKTFKRLFFLLDFQDLSGRLAEIQSGQLSTESLHYQQLSELQEINSGLQQVSHATLSYVTHFWRVTWRKRFTFYIVLRHWHFSACG